MVDHEAPGEYIDIELATPLRQSAKEKTPVLIGQKYWLTVVPPLRDVMSQAGYD